VIRSNMRSAPSPLVVTVGWWIGGAALTRIGVKTDCNDHVTLSVWSLGIGVAVGRG